MPTRKRSRRPFSTYLLCAAAAASLLAVVGVAATRPAIDADANGCSIKTPPQKALVFFMDRTAALSPPQIRAVHEIFGQNIASADVGERIAVYSLDKDWNGLETPLFVACRPPRRESETKSGATETYLEDQYDRFENRINGFVDGLLTAQTASVSPIFEALRAISRTPDYQAATVSRRVIVITDGLENTTAWPESRDATAVYRTLAAGDAPKAVTADLQGARIAFYSLERPTPEKAFETSSQQALFADWLTAQGATLEPAVSLPYGPSNRTSQHRSSNTHV